MMREDILVYAFDWELEAGPFQAGLRNYLKTVMATGKQLALPVKAIPGTAFLEQLSLLLPHVNCAGCNAPCCRSNPSGQEQGVPLLAPEYRRLAQKYPSTGFKHGEDSMLLPFPCPFLEGNRCGIYAERPLVCTLYPLQMGSKAEDQLCLALESECPEARRLALAVYTAHWELRRAFKSALEAEE